MLCESCKEGDWEISITLDFPIRSFPEPSWAIQTSICIECFNNIVNQDGFLLEILYAFSSGKRTEFTFNSSVDKVEQEKIRTIYKMLLDAYCIHTDEFRHKRK